MDGTYEDARLIETIDGRAMQAQVERWVAVNSGTRNLSPTLATQPETLKVTRGCITVLSYKFLFCLILGLPRPAGYTTTYSVALVHPGSLHCTPVAHEQSFNVL